MSYAQNSCGYYSCLRWLTALSRPISVLCEQFETAANMALRGRGAAIVPLAMAERYARGTYYEDKRSYFHAAKVRVYKLNGERIYPDICDATSNADECSVVLPKGSEVIIISS